ncbi:unnamed protein product [Brassica oleracea var. botrytis]
METTLTGLLHKETQTMCLTITLSVSILQVRVLVLFCVSRLTLVMKTISLLFYLRTTKQVQWSLRYGLLLEQVIVSLLTRRRKSPWVLKKTTPKLSTLLERLDTIKTEIRRTRQPAAGGKRKHQSDLEKQRYDQNMSRLVSLKRRGTVWWKLHRTSASRFGTGIRIGTLWKLAESRLKNACKKFSLKKHNRDHYSDDIPTPPQFSESVKEMISLSRI